MFPLVGTERYCLTFFSALLESLFFYCSFFIFRFCKAVCIIIDERKYCGETLFNWKHFRKYWSVVEAYINSLAPMKRQSTFQVWAIAKSTCEIKINKLFSTQIVNENCNWNICFISLFYYKLFTSINYFKTRVVILSPDISVIVVRMQRGEFMFRTRIIKKNINRTVKWAVLTTFKKLMEFYMK